MVLSSVNIGPTDPRPVHTPLAGRRAARVAGGERAPPPRPSRPRARAGPRARRVCAARHLPLSPERWARSGISEVCRRRAGVRTQRVSATARGVCAHLGMAPRTSDRAPTGVRESSGASEAGKHFSLSRARARDVGHPTPPWTICPLGPRSRARLTPSKHLPPFFYLILLILLIHTFSRPFQRSLPQMALASTEKAVLTLSYPLHTELQEDSQGFSPSCCSPRIRVVPKRWH